MGSGLNVERHAIQSRSALPVPDRQVADADLGGTGVGRKRLAPHRFQGLICYVQNLTDSREQVVRVLKQLHKVEPGGRERHDDQFGRDKLPKRNVAARHQEAADAECKPHDQSTEHHRPGELPTENPEVFAPHPYVLRRDLVGTSVNVGRRTVELKALVAARQVFQPVRHGVFGTRLSNACFQAVPAQSPDQHRRKQDRKQTDNQEERTVHEQEKQARQGHERIRQTVQQQLGKAFLHRDDIKEAIDKGRAVLALKGGSLHHREAIRDLQPGRGKQTALQHIDRVVLQERERPVKHKPRGNGAAQNDELIGERAKRHGVDDALRR